MRDKDKYSLITQNINFKTQYFHNNSSLNFVASHRFEKLHLIRYTANKMIFQIHRNCHITRIPVTHCSKYQLPQRNTMNIANHESSTSSVTLDLFNLHRKRLLLIRLRLTIRWIRPSSAGSEFFAASYARTDARVRETYIVVRGGTGVGT